MIIQFPKSDSIKENDLIALTRDDKFIGYGTVITVLEECALVKIDKNTSKHFNELFGEDIPFDLCWGT